MIFCHKGTISIEGDTNELISETSRSLYAIIESQAEQSEEPFEDTAKWMIAMITNSILETNKAIKALKGDST